MALSLQTFSQWVQQQAAAVQSSASTALNFASGSVLRALVEANASVALWMQWLILQALALTRAATSNGSDLDTWMADFAVTRQAAVAATGTVTFAALTGTPTVTIPTGTVVRTSDGTQSFTVTSGATGALPLSLPVAAVNAGTQGNVLAGTISLISAALPGVDTVTNAAGFTSGTDAETDAAFRTRFVNYINTRSLATKQAVGYAISTVQAALTYTVQENVTAGGGYQPGNFVVTFDDGSGNPSAGLIATISAAVETVRPLGSTYTVQGPSTLSPAITYTITAATGYSAPALRTASAAAVLAYVNALPMGAPLPYSRLAQVIYDSTPGIANVTALLVAGATADIGGGATQVVRTSSVVAS